MVAGKSTEEGGNMEREKPHVPAVIIEGSEVEASLDRPVKGKEVVKGKLISRNSNSITIEQDDGKRIEIPWHNVDGIIEA